ncbi:unnamed protein product [Auanema sp. JU1783]|nr:unnamed protein product [Auanema sp. JU1783]
MANPVRIGFLPAEEDVKGCYAVPGCKRPGSDVEIVFLAFRLLKIPYIVIDLLNDYDVSYDMGQKLENGSWTGVTKLLIDNHIDMCGVSMRVTEERNEVIHFSYPTRYFQSIYILKRPSVICPRTFIFNAFSEVTWILIACSILVSVITSFIIHFCHFSLHFPQLSESSRKRWSSILFCALQKGFSFPYSSSRDFPSLMVYNLYLLFVFFIVMQIYQSKMYAYLASPNKYSIPFYSQKDSLTFVENGNGFYTAFAYQKLLCSTDENCQRFQEVTMKRPISRRERQAEIEGDLNIGGIYESTIDSAFLSSPVTWLDNRKQDRIIIQEEDGARYFVAYSFSSKNKKLRNSFNEALIQILPAVPHISSGHGYNTKRLPFQLTSKPNLVPLSLSSHLLQLFKLFLSDVQTPAVFMNVRFPINQEQFDEKYAHSHLHSLTSIHYVKQYFTRFYKPFISFQSFWNLIVAVVPILKWLPRYSMKHFTHDLIGGLTIGIMHVPQGIAYASLAAQEPVIGLYTSLFPVLTYMFFGTSRHCSIGSFAIVALMTGNVVSKLKEDVGVSTTSVEIASVLTFEIGLIQFFLALLKLDFVCTYLTDDLVSGFTTGASMHVFVTQVKDILGIHGLPRRDGSGNLFMRLFDLLKSFHKINKATTCLSIFVFCFLIMGKKINSFRRRKKKALMPIPFDLLAIIVSIFLSLLFKLNFTYNVSTVGVIPTGFPRPNLPRIELFTRLLPDAVSITAVIMSIHISLAKMFSQKYDYLINTNQEFYALGFTSIISGFFPTFPNACSLARTMVNGNVGTRTQLSSVFSSALIFSIIVFIGKWLQPLPMCVLGCIIAAALLPVLQKFKDLRNIWRVSRIDFSVWIVTFTATVLIDVMMGLVVSIVFVLLTSVIRQQWPSWHILGNVTGTSEYRDVQRYKSIHDTEDICIFRFDSPLIFLNSERFSETLKYLSYKCILKEANTKKMNLVQSTKMKRSPCFIIIDCSGFVYVDRMGLKALKDIHLELKKKNVLIYFAAAKSCLREMFIDSGFHRSIPRTVFFPTVHDAVMTAKQQIERSEYSYIYDSSDDLQS